MVPVTRVVGREHPFFRGDVRCWSRSSRSFFVGSSFGSFSCEEVTKVDPSSDLFHLLLLSRQVAGDESGQRRHNYSLE